MSQPSVSDCNVSKEIEQAPLASPVDQRHQWMCPSVLAAKRRHHRARAAPAAIACRCRSSAGPQDKRGAADCVHKRLGLGV